MRFWFNLFILAAICGIFTYSTLYLNEPVTIHFRNDSIAPPLSLLITSGILGLIVLFVILRIVGVILFLPVSLMKWSSNRHQEKKSKLLQSALRAAVYRDKKEQYKVLSQLAPISHDAALRAAQIAQELGWKNEQDKWLHVAAKSSNAITAAAAKVEICRLENRLTEANSILRSAGAPESSMLLAELLYQVSMDLHNYDSAINAATHLKNAAPALWSHTVKDVLNKKAKSSKNSTEMIDFWKDKISSEDKKQEAHVAIYIEALSILGDEKTTVAALTNATKQWPTNTKILLLIADYGSTEQCQSALEKNESRAGNDHDILLAIAKISRRLQLTGKARKYYQMLNAISPNNTQYQEILHSLESHNNL